MSEEKDFIDVMDGMFDAEDFEEYKKAMNEWHEKFIVNQRKYITRMALDNVDMGQFNERQKGHYVNFVELYLTKSGGNEIADARVKLKEAMSGLSIEITLVVVAVLHAEAAMMMKGVLSITEAQVIKRMKEAKDTDSSEISEFKTNMKSMMEKVLKTFDNDD